VRPHRDITVKVYPKVSNDGGWRHLIGVNRIAVAAAEDVDCMVVNYRISVFVVFSIVTDLNASTP